VNAIVFDSSALLALLLREPGAGMVQANLHDACMSSVNFAEVVGFLAKRGATENEIRDVRAISRSPSHRSSRTTLTGVGLLRPLAEKAGLSLGDRACLSLARFRNISAMTADRARYGGASGSTRGLRNHSSPAPNGTRQRGWPEGGFGKARHEAIARLSRRIEAAAPSAENFVSF
jgi:ribonuclease VapC